MIDVSISIVNFNQCALLERCLQSISEGSEGLNVEVFVVDNASQDGSVEMIRERFPWVNLIVNERNRGYAAANNQAIKLSRGRYVLILNNDVFILPGAMQAMVKFMDEHRRVGALGPRVLNPDGTLQRSCSAFPTLWDLLFRALYLDKLSSRNRILGAHLMGYWEHNSLREVDVVSGCCLLIREEAIEQVGLMDERFFFYAEETDWCHRIKRSGWQIYFLPDAEIIHYGGQSTQCHALAMHTELFRSRLRYFDKYYGRCGYFAARFLSILQVGLRLLYYGLSRPFLSRHRREYADRKIDLCYPTLRWLLGIEPR